MALVHCLPPVEDANARVLILGSMPGTESLRQKQYYAHPRNAFWPIIGELLGISPAADYETKTAALQSCGVALWDVLQVCERNGSLDSAIVARTAVANDFAAFFAAHSRIGYIFCNGAAALAGYRRHVMPHLCGAAASLPLVPLPSTSPAHATITRSQKIVLWRSVAKALAVE